MFDITLLYQEDTQSYVVTLRAARLDGEPDMSWEVFAWSKDGEYEFNSRQEAFTAARRFAQGARAMARHAKLLHGHNLGSLISEASRIRMEEAS